MFAQSAALTEAYISLKFSAYTKQDCIEVAKQAARVIEGCKKAKSDVYTNGPKIHGAAQQSQLDLLDIWEMKACAIFDNASDMAAKAK
ncbi:hypothetical protein HUU40_00130 [candidate division KSB1 bacterium]|nr:hypothetical protein [candidate division KSB1 bacterium]